MKRIFKLALWMDGLLALFGTAQAEALRPNIILVFVDDFGCGDLACYGNEKFNTSKLDRMPEKRQRWLSFCSSGSTVFQVGRD